MCVGSRSGSRAADHLAPRHLVATDPGQVERHALAGAGRLHAAVVHLHRAHPGLPAARHDAHAVARGDPPGPQRARDHGARAADAEGAVHVQAGGPFAGAAVDRGRLARQRLAELGDPPAFGRAHGHDRRPGHQLGHLGPGRRRVGQVGARDRHHAALHPQPAQHRQVLARLRHHAVVRCHAEEEQVHAAGPGHHRAHEALVPGHVHQREPPAAGQLERRVPQLDRHPALALLGQAVRVVAGERPHQRRLAVVHVTRRAHGQRLVAHGSSSSSSSSRTGIPCSPTAGISGFSSSRARSTAPGCRATSRNPRRW